jgi:two-component system, LytTR family, sensor kinase
MINPVFKSKKNAVTFFIIMVLLTIKHTLTLVWLLQLDWLIAGIDSFVFISLFAIMLFALWYTIRYSKYTKRFGIDMLFSFIFLVWIFSLLWASSGYYLCYDMFYDNALYLNKLKESMPFRFLFSFFIFSISALIYLLYIYYENLQDKQIQETMLIKKVKEAELNMLKSQINPHFLFNSLNSVSSLTITSPEKAQNMVIKLSDYLRYSITNPENKLQEFCNELNNIERYLEIEKVRFGSKLQYVSNISNECSSATIPVMILQPLYENAVKHGVYESTEPIIIKTVAKVKNEVLLVDIENNFDAEYIPKNGTGIGLKNIKERLKLIYGEDNLIHIKKEDNIFKIRLIIPQNTSINQ